MEQCLRNGVKWGLFMSWSDLVFSQNTMDHIKEVYSSPAVKSLPKGSHTFQKPSSKLNLHVNE